MAILCQFPALPVGMTSRGWRAMSCGWRALASSFRSFVRLSTRYEAAFFSSAAHLTLALFYLQLFLQFLLILT